MFEESLWQVGGPEHCGGCHAVGGRRCPMGAGYGGPLAGHPLHRGCFWLAAPPHAVWPREGQCPASIPI